MMRLRRLSSGLQTSGLLALCVLVVAVVAGAIGPTVGDQHAPPPASGVFPAVGDWRVLDNAHRIHAGLISGAQPETDAAFKLLADLGVRTLISVDGAKPNVEQAKKHGLRYVHLPIKYDGVTREQGMSIARALMDLPGPIYLHCHHGRHRSAAAVAVACVMNAQLPPQQAEDVLRTFGTGAQYQGLWQAARGARPVDPKVLDALKVDFVEVATVPEMAQAMVEIDETFEHLKWAAKHGFRPPPEHPDLDPPHEALQLREKLHELGRTAVAADHPGEFRRLLADNEAAALELEAALRAWMPVAADQAALPPANVVKAFRKVGTSCATCHKSQRD